VQKEISTLPKKKVISKEIQSIENENVKNYFNYDTLHIKKYTSDSGNKIELRGSESNDLYNIKINGKFYKIAESWYQASHSYIIWDNKDFVFLRYGCGTECWGGKLLSINGKKQIRDFPFYLYTDSINNYVVYPDTTEIKKICFENIKSKQRKTIEFDLCEEAALPILTIDTIFGVENKKIVVIYTDKNCRRKKKKVIELH
jgi:hypothetical protein